jgi:hypothetical protein
MAERLERAMSWNRFAGEVAAAGAGARGRVLRRRLTRTTIDLDVIAAWTPENMRRLAGALRELKAERRGVDAELLGLDLGDPKTLYDGGNFLMRTAMAIWTCSRSSRPRARRRAMRICERGRSAVEIRDVTLLIANPDDLIRMKSTAAQFRDRPAPKRRQDLDDIAVLERLRTSQTQAEPPTVQPPTRTIGPAGQPPARYEPPKLDGPKLSR